MQLLIIPVIFFIFQYFWKLCIVFFPLHSYALLCDGISHKIPISTLKFVVVTWKKYGISSRDTLFCSNRQSQNEKYDSVGGLSKEHVTSCQVPQRIWKPFALYFITICRNWKILPKIRNMEIKSFHQTETESTQL